MCLLQRYWVHSTSVIKAFIDYLVDKGVDIEDNVLDDNQPAAEGRFKSNSEQRWRGGKWVVDKPKSFLSIFFHLISL